MSVDAFALFALLLFCLGLYAVLARRNLIAILIGIELMLNAASLNVLAFNRFVAPDPAVGQILVLFVIGLAAAEAAIALSIIVAVYRQRSDIDVDDLRDLTG
ncbi:MAG: NADH-quinone oxidoreductase subunit NuoK [Myxococcota bacterium]|jgi:NADH:ubiquinone oxidoreductase subunit K|nr:NADH-quinone oxidoreductase subunit NuoK [Myxococcota bacterium]